MNTEEFVSKARAIHGSKYDYSQVKNPNAKTKVDIFCPLHGVFSQRAASHLDGSGCKECALAHTAQLKISRRKGAICQHCGEKFQLIPSAQARGEGKYCSRRCYESSREIAKKTCLHCGKEFVSSKTSAKYCSSACAAEKSRSSLQAVLRRFREMHGDKYCYKKVEYVNMNTPVEIECLVHGEWTQRPADHILGHGCPKCAKASLSVKMREDAEVRKINVTCPSCGEIIRRSPYEASRLIFCSPECASDSKRLSIQQFVERATNVHGDEYDYKNVLIPSAGQLKLANITIRCKVHGDFQLTIGAHLKGAGCPFCNGRRINKEVFLSKVNSMNHRSHLYDYGNIDSIGSSNERITIICKIHGSFEQTVSRHIAGDGCPACSYEERGAANSQRASDTWIYRAASVHGGKYDYSKAEYVSARQKVCIICPEHGVFWQSPNNHINGAGCPACGAKGGFDVTKPGMLYYLRVSNGTHTAWKIGITNFNVSHRYKSEKIEISVLEVWDYSEGLVALDRETEILRRYRSMKYSGPPLFKGGGNTELFEVDVLGLDPNYSDGIFN